MSAASEYLKNQIINATLCGIPYTSPESVYVALFPLSANLVEIKMGSFASEQTGNSYERKSVDFPMATEGITSNILELVWEGLPATTIGYVAICDSKERATGNVLYCGPLRTPKKVRSGRPYTLHPGDIDVSLN
jgi:hypothetical protein